MWSTSKFSNCPFSLETAGVKNSPKPAGAEAHQTSFRILSYSLEQVATNLLAVVVPEQTSGQSLLSRHGTLEIVTPSALHPTGMKYLHRQRLKDVEQHTLSDSGSSGICQVHAADQNSKLPQLCSALARRHVC